MRQFPQSSRSRPEVGAGRSGQGNCVGPADAVTFGPEAAVRAIVFHLLDEQLAREVEAESVRRTVDRLHRDGVRLTIRRGMWRGMTHPQRLAWLLSESLTTPLRRRGVVALQGRDERQTSRK